MLCRTKYGLINGRVQDGMVSFLGIPYAKPPVGELRWKAPKPPESWEGVREADAFGRACVQPRVQALGVSISNDGPQGEDCLYLNIWTPEDALVEGRRLPVLVTIHGGGFVAFSGAVPALSGQELAKKGVVVVTINYRLGVMGFFSHPELSAEDAHGVSGNYGILDQIAALRWVKENIREFGGDPDQVTVSGESAGAFSVSVLCMSPLTEGLFARAMAWSGAFMDKRSVMYELLSLKEAQKLCREAVGNKGLEELRSMPAEELLELTGPIASRCLMPVQDDYVFPVDVEKVFREKRFRDVPLLLGSNREDGAQFARGAGAALKLEGVGEKLAGRERTEEFLRIYPEGDEEETLESKVQLFSDSAFGHNMYAWSGLQSSCGKSPVYLYYYCHVPPETDLGAYHSTELPYFHRNLGNSARAWRPVDYDLQEVYSAYILNFVKRGDPNGAGLGSWKTFQEGPKEIMILDEEPHMERHPRLEAMKFWDKIGGKKWRQN